ncbi:MAG: CvpA family protein [Bacilli bacterium]|nr:CvpA family protein [Bacilli bacterium]
MNIFDIGILVILIMFFIVGWKKGVIKETVSLVGLIVIFIVAFTFKEEIGNVLCKYLPFFTFEGNIKGLVSLNILIYQMIGFIIIYSVLYAVYQIILKISGIFQKIVNWTLILALPSKLAGAIIGLVEGYLIVFALLLVAIVPLKDHELIRESKLTNFVVYKTPIISNYTSNITDTVTDVYKLVDDLVSEKLTVNEANLEIIDTMIEYDIVSKKTVEQLVVLDKLKEVKGLDKVLDKHK